MTYSKIPDISFTAVKFPDISRFSRQVVTRKIKNERIKEAKQNKKLSCHRQAVRCFTETVLPYILDHLINAIGSRKNSCLCFLIYRPPLILLTTCLSSWFGIHGTALNRFRSHLSSRCFNVNNSAKSLKVIQSH